MGAKMNDGFSGAIAAFVAKYGAAGAFGMLGAALLYVIAPPVDKNERFNRKEFAIRLAVAGVVSSVFGDWSVAMLMEFLPRLHADEHKAAVWLMTGAPGWWISRAVALGMYNTKDHDIFQLMKLWRK